MKVVSKINDYFCALSLCQLMGRSSLLTGECSGSDSSVADVRDRILGFVFRPQEEVNTDNRADSYIWSVSSQRFICRPRSLLKGNINWCLSTPDL
jgi:hypothetical protein